MLSETCQIFPREIHEFQDHKEATMMPCCPAVLDIWKEKKRIAFPETPKEKEQPLFLVRRKVMDLIMDPEKTPEEILLESFYVLKELHWNMPHLPQSLWKIIFQRKRFANWNMLLMK